MPLAPLRPCSSPGCPGTTREGRFCPHHLDPAARPLSSCARAGCPNGTRERLCSEHETAALAQAAQQVSRERRDPRPSAARRGYGRAWRDLRRLFLRAHPRCERCGAKATEVDHRRSRRLGGRDEVRNLTALCKSCHSGKTVRVDGGFGRRRRPPRS